MTAPHAELPPDPYDQQPGEDLDAYAARLATLPSPPFDVGDEGEIPPIAGDRPEIEVREELVAVTDAAIAALRRSGGLFVRARMLVQLGRADGLEDPATRLTRPHGAPVIVPVSAAALRDQLDHSARWVKAAGRKHKTRVAALPPMWVAEQIIARTAWPFPPLEGVVATPVLRPDGSVLDTPGYDRTTGLWYEPASRFPHVPATPGRPEAEAALNLLLQPVADFPFTDASGRTAYLAAVLSLVGRHAVAGCVPGFAISSPTPGTGKGLLARVIATIGTGRPSALMGRAADDDEFRKRVLAIALAGTPMVVLDNLSGALGSDILASALTATTWSDRMLGFSTIVDVPLGTVWAFTGNNLSFKRTLGRRIVPIYLDARLEHPEDRDTFAIADLPAFVEQARPALATAALTVLRAYFLAGRPRHAGPRMGSFEAWDDLVRGACIWLGLADPARTDDPTIGRGRIRASLDEDREGLGVVLAMLVDAFADRPFTAAEATEHAKTSPSLELAFEVAGAVNRDGHVTGKAVGYLFRTAESRIVDGRQLVTTRTDGHSKVRLWRVLGRNDAGDAGNAGNGSGPFARGKQGDVFLKEEGREVSPASPALPADDSDAP